jgi:hypothetical protein
MTTTDPTQATLPINGTIPKPASEAKPAAAIVPATDAVPDEPARAISAFSSDANFNTAQRIAMALAKSTLVPKAYQNNIPNVLIAMELASRIGASVFAVMQNADPIHGRLSWRATFLIATVNASGKFTPLRFRWQGKEGTDTWGCRAVARDRDGGEECLGSLITIATAKAEGWYQREGSKWKTIPEQMLVYRAAAFWTRIYSPELSLGMHTSEEISDITGVDVPEVPTVVAPGNTQALEAELLGQTVTADGEVVEATPEAQ